MRAEGIIQVNPVSEIISLLPKMQATPENVLTAKENDEMENEGWNSSPEFRNIHQSEQDRKRARFMDGYIPKTP
jgi:hypothetical protein